MITGLSIKSNTYTSNKEAALPTQYIDQHTKKGKTVLNCVSAEMSKKTFDMQFLLSIVSQEVYDDLRRGFRKCKPL